MYWPRSTVELACRILSSVAPLILTIGSCHAICAQTIKTDHGIEQLLVIRLSENPDDATAWRMLGRIRLSIGDGEGAVQACQKSIELSPLNASAHFDLGRALLHTSQFEQAQLEFLQVIELAPETDYGRESHGFLQQIKTNHPEFDVAPDFEEAVVDSSQLKWDDSHPTESGLRSSAARVDFGMLYNSNVELAPISRDVLFAGTASFQGFVAPQFEVTWKSAANWTSGLNFDGLFTLNEGNQSQFDLQEYRPGSFVEHRLAWGPGETIAKFQYDFSLSQFEGQTFANRHSMTSSFIIEQDLSDSVIYWSIDYSNFDDDGISPSTTSLDGWTNTIGGIHIRYVYRKFVDSVRGGIDVQLANLEGSDFAYDGVFMFVGTHSFLAPIDSDLNLQFGWGHRDYSRFTSLPSRNENLWHGNIELLKQLSPHWHVRGFLTFDRFASPNLLFDAERYFAGFATGFVW